MCFLLYENAVIVMNSCLDAMIEFSLHYLLLIIALSQSTSPNIVTYTTRVKAFMRVKIFDSSFCIFTLCYFGSLNMHVSWKKENLVGKNYVF